MRELVIKNTGLPVEFLKCPTQEEGKYCRNWEFRGKKSGILMLDMKQNFKLKVTASQFVLTTWMKKTLLYLTQTILDSAAVL